MILRISSHAEEEVEAAFDYYNAQRTNLGREFLDAFLRGLQRIAEAPQRWPRDHAAPDVHRYRIDPFPYAIVYQVRSDHCLVVAVMNLWRRPGYWRDRLPVE